MWPALVAATADRIIRYMVERVESGDNALTAIKYRRKLLSLQQHIDKRLHRTR